MLAARPAARRRAQAVLQARGRAARRSTSAAAAACCSSGSSRDGYERVVGVDVSPRALDVAARRLQARPPADAPARARRAPAQPADLPRPAPARLRRGRAGRGDRAPRPAAAGGASRRTCSALRSRATVVVTTPNAEYNARWETLPAGSCATPTTASSGRAREFAAWADGVAGAHGYAVALPAGRRRRTPRPAPPTQMAVFEPMKIDHSRAVPGRARWARPAPARARSRPRTSCRPRSSRRDFCRGLVSDDENDQAATDGRVRGAARRSPPSGSSAGRLTVVDATNVQPEARAPLVALAREHDLLRGRDRARRARARSAAERNAAAARPRLRRRTSIRRQRARAAPLAALPAARGLPLRHVLRRSRTMDAARSCASRCGPTAAHEHGPFDIIGDVHGCYDELVDAAGELARLRSDDGRATPRAAGSCFVGDLVDRGPGDARRAAARDGHGRGGTALCVPGNHDNKLARKLAAATCRITPRARGDARAARRPRPEFARASATFLDGLDQPRRARRRAARRRPRRACPSATRAAPRGACASSRSTARRRARPTSSACRSAAPGPTTTAARATVVYGHTPVAEPEWVNNTINIDTGCVFGGALTALRWPGARAGVACPPRATYYEPARPFLDAGRRRAPPTSCSTSTTSPASASSRRGSRAR